MAQTLQFANRKMLRPVNRFRRAETPLENLTRLQQRARIFRRINPPKDIRRSIQQEL